MASRSAAPILGEHAAVEEATHRPHIRSEATDVLPLLEVSDLTLALDRSPRPVELVSGVSFSLHRGQTLCLVGESGCGKSVTALSLARLLPSPPVRITAGQVLLRDPRDGEDAIDISRLRERELARIRGRRVAFVFQEPMTALHPLRQVGEQLREGIKEHLHLRSRAAWSRAEEWLARVGVDQPALRMRQFPHELSGGLRQRVMIAMALAMEPSVLVADEPTTALDGTLQLKILDLLAKLQREAQLGLILITHDLGVVARIADHVAVMYAGRIVERASAAELFTAPRHPYTRALLACLPPLHRGDRVQPGDAPHRLATIPGRVPDPVDYASGCRFAPRCALTREWACGAAGAQVVEIPAQDQGRAKVLARCVRGEPGIGAAPPLVCVGAEHEAACWEVAPPQRNLADPATAARVVR